MAKDRNGSVPKEVTNRDGDEHEEECKDRHKRSKRKKKDESESESSSSGEQSSSESDSDRHRSRSSSRSRNRRRRHSRRRSRDSDDDSDSESDESDEGSESDDDTEEKRRRRKKRRREREEEEKERRRRRREKRRKREKEEKRKKKKKDKSKDKKKKRKKEKDAGKKGAVTNLWGKYGIIRETDMWNKRPEFTAWLAEVKQVNLETLPNWEEKQMFKEFMEDHNTATFPSKKYYDLDAYHRREIEKEMKKGLKKVAQSERTVFNDEEQRRLELQRERERQKEEQIQTLKTSMQGGMAQAMKEQARLREEMAYQYRLGNFEAAAAIQRRLDPDVAM